MPVSLNDTIWRSFVGVEEHCPIYLKKKLLIFQMRVRGSRAGPMHMMAVECSTFRLLSQPCISEPRPSLDSASHPSQLFTLFSSEPFWSSSSLLNQGKLCSIFTLRILVNSLISLRHFSHSLL